MVGDDLKEDEVTPNQRLTDVCVAIFRPAPPSYPFGGTVRETFVEFERMYVCGTVGEFSKHNAHKPEPK